jgi:tryptophan synthase alpha chain
MKESKMKIFSDVFSTHKKVLIPFIMAGVPSLNESEDLATALIEEGAKILELGVPFSDPSADGVVLQHASEVALKNAVTLKNVLELAKKISHKHPSVPIVLFTYLNPILALGLENYIKLAVDSGVSATLTVDMPLEEAQDYIQLHKQYGLGMVFLASPTTSLERLKKIQAASTAFLYYISRTGVTGEQQAISSSLAMEVSQLREVVKTPLAIGFGISNAEQSQAVAQFADGVIIGSAFMRIILENNDAQKREVLLRNLARTCSEAVKRAI